MDTSVLCQCQEISDKQLLALDPAGSELHYSPGTRPEHPETWQLSPVTEHSAQQKFLLLESSEEHRPRALKSALHFCRFVTSHDPHFSQI